MLDPPNPRYGSLSQKTTASFARVFDTWGRESSTGVAVAMSPCAPRSRFGPVFFLILVKPRVLGQRFWPYDEVAPQFVYHARILNTFLAKVR